MNDKKKNDEVEVGGVVGAVMEHHRRHRRRSRNFLLVGVASVAALLGTMTVIGLVLSFVESSNVRDIYGETLAGLCRDLPMGDADIANLPAPDGTAKMLLLRQGTQQRHPWHGELPLGWRAESGDEVGLVGCVLMDRADFGHCEYPRIGAEGDQWTARIERYQTTATVTLLNPTSGQRIAERSVIGGEPDPCPPDSEDLNTAQRFEGEEPSSQEFAEWLESFAVGTAG
jgi:hypothetical protein